MTWHTREGLLSTWVHNHSVSFFGGSGNNFQLGLGNLGINVTPAPMAYPCRIERIALLAQIGSTATITLSFDIDKSTDCADNWETVHSFSESIAFTAGDFICANGKIYTACYDAGDLYRITPLVFSSDVSGPVRVRLMVGFSQR